MSGLTSPPHAAQRTTVEVMTASRMRAPSKPAWHSMQCWSANEPCASTMRVGGTPARRSSVSMFCVKHVSSSARSASSFTNVWVSVGRNWPG